VSAQARIGQIPLDTFLPCHPGVMSRDAFGPNLRRIRVQKGISVEQIADRTRIPADLLTGLEQNDFSGWPSGIFARAYVRQYAEAIGEDPDATVDEFCRWFLEGDRRAERVIREHAEIVGHELEWDEQVPSTVEHDRRNPPDVVRAVQTPHSPFSDLVVRLRRAFGKA
jgi:transcriptional regulator with XRE-family HTH domain